MTFLTFPLTTLKSTLKNPTFGGKKSISSEFSMGKKRKGPSFRTHFEPLPFFTTPLSVYMV